MPVRSMLRAVLPSAGAAVPREPKTGSGAGCYWILEQFWNPAARFPNRLLDGVSVYGSDGLAHLARGLSAPARSFLDSRRSLGPVVAEAGRWAAESSLQDA